MKFWKVALAIVMLETLKLAWGWVVGTMGTTFDWAPFIAVTLFWFFVSFAAWSAMRAIANTIARDRHLGEDR